MADNFFLPLYAHKCNTTCYKLCSYVAPSIRFKLAMLFGPYLDFRSSLVVHVYAARIFTHQKIYLHLGFNNNENDLISYYSQ